MWPARVGGVNATQPVSGLQPQVARYMRYCNNGVLFPTGTSFTIADVQALNPEGQVRDRMGFFFARLTWRFVSPPAEAGCSDRRCDCASPMHMHTCSRTYSRMCSVHRPGCTMTSPLPPPPLPPTRTHTDLYQFSQVCAWPHKRSSDRRMDSLAGCVHCMAGLLLGRHLPHAKL